MARNFPFLSLAMKARKLETIAGRCPPVAAIGPKWRCVHVTDLGVGYVSTITTIRVLYLRWCTQLRDFGLTHVCNMRNLEILSLAGESSLPPLTPHRLHKTDDEQHC
ncbi:uncharacterized protein CDAR_565931 [Caerostris darwini]|uniref:Uncharacterized protein n=1 Tax=Caerostris darwini TaxID=1538125 RepID=A0AAV4W8B3_9ARAC|nr:uncharacterized protein CDAR_565931 [Caerostris darwini]